MMNMKMKNLSMPLIAIGVFAASALAAWLTQNGRDRKPARKRRIVRREHVNVYITDHGRKYHKRECPLVRGRGHALPIGEALTHYEPCPVCHPEKAWEPHPALN